jgi:hypothetical protein
VKHHLCPLTRKKQEWTAEQRAFFDKYAEVKRRECSGPALRFISKHYERIDIDVLELIQGRKSILDIAEMVVY